MDIIKNSDYESGLYQSGRVYLCGNLKQPSSTKYLPTDAYEIGMSVYPNFTFEKPHYHSFNKEYNFVLEGKVKVFLIEKNQEIELGKGDLYVINQNEPYVGKYYPGTKIMFSKVPGGNDKVLVNASEQLLLWGSSWESTF